MEIHEPYIPKEYLALKINYIKKQLAELPEVTVTQRTIRKTLRDVYIVDSKTIIPTSRSGEWATLSMQKRDSLLGELAVLEAQWNRYFRGLPPQDIAPANIHRRLFINNSKSVILDSNYFNSLKNDADPNYRENKTFFYNGTFYRSAAEVDIARFYTEQGIPFKYEPEIWLRGLNFPIYTDFVILIRELNLCKFHEHFGMKNAANYNKITATKYNNYSGAGLLPELDVFYTYDVDGYPFDTRSLCIKLNSVVYNSLLGFGTDF